MDNMEVIHKEQRRKRLDSIPIITGIENTRNKEDRKRRRSDTSESDMKKMETFKGLNSEDDDTLVVIETRVISGIIENMEEGNVKSLIDCFNPLIRHSPEKIKQQMLNCSMKWTNKKEIYIGAINYIEHGRQDTRDKEKQLKDLEVDSLCEILVREVENRMPKHCKQCDDWYIVQLVDRPEIHCMWCKVGKHDCIELNKVIKDQGFKWLCEKCEPVFTEHFLQKLDQTATFEGFIENIIKSGEDSENKKMKTASVTKKEINREPENDANKKVHEEEEITEIVDSSEDHKKSENDVTIIPSRRENDENRNGSVSLIEDQNKNEGNNTKKEICWFWKNKKCRFGENCKNEHPEQCKDMLETGLCKESRCKKLHPKICRNLFYRGICPRGNSCWFTHPTNCTNNENNNNSNHDNRRSYTSNTENTLQRTSLYGNVVVENGNQNLNQGFHPYQNNEDFLWKWPKPAETSMHLQQTLSRLIGTMEKVDARVENLEKRQMTRWAY